MSKRLQTAALAEIRRLQKRHDRLMQRVAPLQAEADEIAERLAAVRRIVDEEMEMDVPVAVALLGPPNSIVLSGRAIRIQAVRSMLTRHRPGHAAHYTDWYAVFQEDGFAIDSPDPLATFLTQLGRSPWVRRSSQKGIYALADANPAATLDGQAQGAYTVARTTCDEDEMMRYLRAARAFGRQRDEALVSTPPRAALAAAEEDAS